MGLSQSKTCRFKRPFPTTIPILHSTALCPQPTYVPLEHIGREHGKTAENSCKVHNTGRLIF